MTPQNKTKRVVSKRSNPQSGSDVTVATATTKEKSARRVGAGKSTVKASKVPNTHQYSVARAKTAPNSSEIVVAIEALTETIQSYAAHVSEQANKQAEIIQSQAKMFQTQIEMQKEMKESVDQLQHDLHDSDGFLAKNLAPIKFDLRDPDGHVAKMFKAHDASLRAEIKESEARLRTEIKESDARASVERQKSESGLRAEIKESESRLRAEIKESDARASTERQESEARIILAIEVASKRAKDYTDKKVAENNLRMLKYVGGFVVSLLAGAAGYAEWIVHRLGGK